MWVGFVFFAVGGALEDGEGITGSFEEGDFRFFLDALVAVGWWVLVGLLSQELFGGLAVEVLDGGVCAVFEEKLDDGRVGGAEEGSAAKVVLGIGIGTGPEEGGDVLRQVCAVEGCAAVFILSVGIGSVF